MSFRSRFTPDTGPPLQRQRVSRMNHLKPWVLHLTLAQFAVFESFFQATLGHGAGAFRMVDPFSKKVETWLFEGDYESDKSAANYVTVSFELRQT